MAAAKPSSLPTLLTALRIAAGPVVAGLILWADTRVFVDGGAGAANLYLWAFALFVLAAITDAVDGALARKLDAVTPFGAALDHAADKVLLSATLIALCATVFSWPLVIAAILLIGRDTLIGGIREGMAGKGGGLAVGRLGKLKTALAFVGAGGAILVQALTLGQAALPVLPALALVVHAALWAAVAAALVSAFGYLRAAAAQR